MKPETTKTHLEARFDKLIADCANAIRAKDLDVKMKIRPAVDQLTCGSQTVIVASAGNAAQCPESIS